MLSRFCICSATPILPGHGFRPCYHAYYCRARFFISLFLFRFCAISLHSALIPFLSRDPFTISFLIHAFSYLSLSTTNANSFCLFCSVLFCSEYVTIQLIDSNRFGQYRAAYQEVQERHEDIQRIERTLGELAQLFSDVSTFFLPLLHLIIVL
jgi:hypothetical protein